MDQGSSFKSFEIIDRPQILTYEKLDKYIGQVEKFTKEDKYSFNNKLSHLVYQTEETKQRQIGITLISTKLQKNYLRSAKHFLRQNTANLFHLLVEKDFAQQETLYFDKSIRKNCEIDKNQVGEMKFHLRNKKLLRYPYPGYCVCN